MTLPARERHGLLPPFLAALRARAGLSLGVVGARIGRTYSPVYRAESAPGGVSREIVLGIARACGATEEEMARVEVLDALDRGALPLPDGADEDRVRRALAILRGEAT